MSEENDFNFNDIKGDEAVGAEAVTSGVLRVEPCSAAVLEAVLAQSGVGLGVAGPAGAAPVKGTDYFTEADKQELAAAAAAQVSVPVSSVDGQTGAVSLAGTYATPADLTARLNRSTDVHAADTAYTTYMARGEALFAQETTPTVNGAIAWQYE